MYCFYLYINKLDRYKRSLIWVAPYISHSKVWSITSEASDVCFSFICHVQPKHFLFVWVSRSAPATTLAKLARVHIIGVDGRTTFSHFAYWFQSGLISQPTVFSSHNKPALVRLISPETNQRIYRLCSGVSWSSHFHQWTEYVYSYYLSVTTVRSAVSLFGRP